MSFLGINKSKVLTFLIVVATVRVFWQGLKHLRPGNFLWDLNVYQLAVENYLNGADAYAITEKLAFVYHPIVLQLFSIPGQHLKIILILFYIATSLIFIKTILNEKNLVIPFTLGISWHLVLCIATGNITFFLHLGILALLLNKSYAGNKIWMYLGAVLVFSVIKPYMIAYLAIPFCVALLKNENVLTVAKYITISFLGYVLLMVSHSILFNELFLSFYNALQTQIVTRGDGGTSIFTIVNKLGLFSKYWAFLVHFGIISMGIFFLFRYFKKASINIESFVLYLYCLLTLLNPRLKQYDTATLLGALFMAIFITNNIFQSQRKLTKETL